MPHPANFYASHITLSEPRALTRAAFPIVLSRRLQRLQGRLQRRSYELFLKQTVNYSVTFCSLRVNFAVEQDRVGRFVD